MATVTNLADGSVTPEAKSVAVVTSGAITPATGGGAPRDLGNWSQRVSAVCACLTFLVALLAVGVAYWNLEAVTTNITNAARASKEQSEARERQIQTELVRDRNQLAEEAVARLYVMDNTLNAYMGGRPRVRKCLRGEPTETAWKSLNDVERSECIAAAGMLGNELDYYMIVRRHLVHKDVDPELKKQMQQWNNWLKDVVKNSVVFRSYIKATRQSWTEELVKAVDEHAAGLTVMSRNELGLPEPAPQDTK